MFETQKYRIIPLYKTSFIRNNNNFSNSKISVITTLAFCKTDSNPEQLGMGGEAGTIDPIDCTQFPRQAWLEFVFAITSQTI